MLVAVLLVPYALVLMVPWQPRFPEHEIDNSWVMVLHWAHAHRVDFGHDMTFTFGPWGFIWAGYSPETFAAQIFAWLVMTGAMLAGLAAVARRMRRPTAGLVWAVMVITLVGLPIQQFEDLRMLLLCCLLIVLHLHVDDRPLTATKALLLVAVALASLVKFTLGMLSAGAVILLAIEDIRRRRVPWSAGIYLLALLGFWLAASQPLSGLGPWALNSWDLAAHYPDGESVDSPDQGASVAMFLICAAPLPMLIAIAGRQTRRPLGQIGIRCVAAILPAFLAFKNGFVRHENIHDLCGWWMLMVVWLLWGVVLWPKMRGVWARGLVIVMVVLTCSIAWRSLVQSAGGRLTANLVRVFTALPDRATAAIGALGGSGDSRQFYQRFVSDLAAKNPLPPTRGTVDIYSWEDGLAVAHGLDCDFRPVFQGYLTYTPRLARLNADFLRGPRAPESILFDVNGLEDRWPSIDESLSWPILLTRYDVVDATGAMLTLRKSAGPREYSISPISQTQASMQQWTAVPESSDPIWTTVDVPITPMGKMIGVAYKRPKLYLSARLADGRTIQRVAAPEIMRNGFLLSPMVLNRQEFGILESTRWGEQLAGSRVTQISVSADTSSGTSICFGDDVKIRFSRLSFPHVDLDAVPGLER